MIVTNVFGIIPEQTLYSSKRELQENWPHFWEAYTAFHPLHYTHATNV